MAKNLKLKIKNSQLSEALSLGKISLKKEDTETKAPKRKVEHAEEPLPEPDTSLVTEEAPRIRAKAHSSFGPKSAGEDSSEDVVSDDTEIVAHTQAVVETPSTYESVAERLFHPVPDEAVDIVPAPLVAAPAPEEPIAIVEPALPPAAAAVEPPISAPPQTPYKASLPPYKAPYKSSNQPPYGRSHTPSPFSKSHTPSHYNKAPPVQPPAPSAPHTPAPPFKPREAAPKFITPPAVTKQVRLGPTGRHVNDLLPANFRARPPVGDRKGPAGTPPPTGPYQKEGVDRRKKTPPAAAPAPATAGRPAASDESAEDANRRNGKTKEFRDVKPLRKGPSGRFDTRDRHGLRAGEEDEGWRRRRATKDRRFAQEETIIRPTTLKVRMPISIKELASEMKLKASELVSKLFLQGRALTLNDILNDETEIQLLGQDFGCAITIDTSEEERIRITDKTVREEIAETPADQLVLRPPVVAFMGHVDHGKTSLIDAIRNSNRVAGEAGAITQHIGAFRTHTKHGDIAILDTPGHEAFTAMRTRGAGVTDIVVLVVAGDEGVMPQTIEALEQARTANVTIVVAINKCDKPNFNLETVYRQLAEQNLLPEAWGGTTITVNCSAVTQQGIPELLEMLALQAEVLELRANPNSRARGAVLESEMHKGMGTIATVLVQTGTLRLGDAIVFDDLWGRVKTMRNEFGKNLAEAGPSTPVEITGLSDLPEAGHEFIVVKNEKEAREIAEARRGAQRELFFQQKKRGSMESLLQEAAAASKKTLRLVLRADVQGSLEALGQSLTKIKSSKVEIEIISSDVGEISESDIQLAAVSKATIVGFQTRVESHAETLIKELGVSIKLFDIIYHAVDGIKDCMTALLDKIPQENATGEAEVRAVFKSSQLGAIAGCMVTTGNIHRNHLVRLVRGGEVVWKGTISSLKRVKEDVREVKKGIECGILLNGYSECQEGDIIQAYEITYLSQSL